jgi:DNA-binding transcriptional LysR family regulator
LLAQFHRLHPEVSVELMGSAPALDLARREADLAVRATRKPPDASLGRRVCEFRFGIYAAPEYLKCHGRTPLAEHDWCMITGALDWLVPLVWKKKSDGEQRLVLTGGLTATVQQAAREGMGLTVLPCYVGDGDPALVRATELLEPLTLELWILTHPDLRHTARVKALLAFLHEALTKERELFEGTRPRSRKKPPLQVGA